MNGKKKKIGQKVNSLLLTIVSITMLMSGGVSIYNLYSMKQISEKSSRQLGETAAEDAKEALKQMAAKHLQDIAVERAAYIEQKFEEVEAYVRGIAAQAETIYASSEAYPDREVELPVPDSKELAAQLLVSQRLENPKKEELEELLKLGNIQDMLVQYNAQNDMVSSTYLATASGWMIQADYIAYSKYGAEQPMPYEADERQWYQRAMKAADGEVIYTDVIADVHAGGDCIVCASPVYFDGKVVAVAGVGSYLETVNHAVLNTSVGEGGYAILVNEKGQIMVSPKTEGETAATAGQEVDLRKIQNAKLAETAEKMVQGDAGFTVLTLDGREVYLAYAPLPELGWSFVTVLDAGEVTAPAEESQKMILKLTKNARENQNRAIQRMILYFGTLFAAFACFISLFGALFSRWITNPIRTLTKEVEKFDGGSLDYRIHLKTGDEVEELGKAFNGMAAQIQKYIRNLSSVTAERERINTELQLASRLQADMLPDASGAFAKQKEFAIDAAMTPAKGVGGDFYDFFLLDRDHLALVMADVSGKGIPAALFMVVARTFIRSNITAGIPLAQAVAEINENLCENNKNDMFVTAWLGVLTISTGMLEFVNAGHCRPLLVHENGTCEYEDSRGGFVLAGIEGSVYRQSSRKLLPGDTVFLYTDGVTEATSVQGELYGEERLENAVSGQTNLTPKLLISQIWDNVDQFQKGAEQFDDITMLAITYYGRDSKKKSGKPELVYLPEYAEFLEETLREWQVSGKTIVEFQIALDEIFSNICRYSGAKEVELEIWVGDAKENPDKKEVTLLFRDDGVPYDPLKREQPDMKQPLSERKEGGLGIYLVRQQMDRMEYKYEDGKNCLTICKEDA